MDEGSLRCDVNISVAPVDSSTLGERVEVKNLTASDRWCGPSSTSGTHLECESGEPQQRHETRTFDAGTGVTIRTRSKESAPDYRFLPDPDLHPCIVEEDELRDWAGQLPRLPDEIRHELQDVHGLSLYDASVIVEEPGAPAFFEGMIARASQDGWNTPAKVLTNWFVNEVFKHVKEDLTLMRSTEPDEPSLSSQQRESPVTPGMLAELVIMFTAGSSRRRALKGLSTLL